MLILLDSDGNEVAALDYDAMPNSVLIDDGREFEFEARDGNDYIYREVER